MADKNKDKSTPESIAPVTGRADRITTALMMTAALAAITGFAMLFSVWFRSGISDDYEVLRIAAQEFVEGRPIIAGELAAGVRFESEGPVPAEPPVGDEVDPDQAAIDALPPEGVDPADVMVPETDDSMESAADPLAEWMSLRDFLVGAGLVARAGDVDDFRQQQQRWMDAIEPLEKSRRDGFPPGRQTDGHRMLGEAYFHVGRFPEAAQSLILAVKRDPTIRRKMLPMIAESQLRSPSIEAAQPAVQTIEEYLADKTLPIEQRWLAQSIRVRALMKLGRYGDAAKAADAILVQPVSTDVSVQAAEIDHRNEILLYRNIIEVRKAIDQYGALPIDALEDRSEAAAMLSEPLERLGQLSREASPQTSSLARLWLARGYLAEGNLDDGLNLLTILRQSRPFSPEAILGGLEEIELLARQGRGVEVLQTTRYLMREIGDPSGFDSDAVTMEEFGRRLIDAIGKLRQTGDFRNSIDTARSLPPVFQPAEALAQEAITYRQWAEATIADGTDINGEVSTVTSTRARARYRAAGDAFARVAELKFDTADYLPAQWDAIDSYQKGRHFRRSIRLLEPYLRYEDRRRLPRGLVAFGRALLAEGDEEKAIEAVEACIIEYPRDPLRYDARLIAAQAHAELRELDRARQYLMDNLRDGDLTPASPAWRDSLLKLSEIRYEEAYQNQLAANKADSKTRFDRMRENQPILSEAIRYLDESVERYGIPVALNAAYLAGRARLLAAQWPRIEAESPETLEAAKRSLQAQSEQELQIALDRFVDLRRQLVAREEEARLPPHQDAILRNCFMAEADTLREMNRLDEAIDAYRVVELRYINEPTSLEAILGRSGCAKDLGRRRESDLLVKQASVVLSRIPAEWNERFAELTRFDREGWEDYLTWMNSRIES